MAAKIKLNLSGIADKFKDFLSGLLGEQIIILEPGKEPQYLNEEEYADYRKQIEENRRKKDEEEQKPSPTPTAQPRLARSRDSRSRVEESRGDDELTGFRTTDVPDDFTAAIKKASAKYDIDPNLIAAGLFQESSFRPKVVTEGETASGQKFKARGAAQIVDIFHPEVSDEQAFDPEFAADYYAKYIDTNRDKFGGDLSRALASYYVGSGGAGVEGPEPYGGGPQGQTYINNVARNLTYDLIKDLGLKVSPSLLAEYGI